MGKDATRLLLLFAGRRAFICTLRWKVPSLDEKGDDHLTIIPSTMDPYEVDTQLLVPFLYSLSQRTIAGGMKICLPFEVEPESTPLS